MPSRQQHPLVKQIYFDGWYTSKTQARALADHVAEDGATTLGLLESQHGTWGVLYVSSRVLFHNHVLDGDSPLWAPLNEPA